jgi:hypothetical protein
MNIIAKMLINQQTLDSSLDSLKTLRELEQIINLDIIDKQEELEQNEVYQSMLRDQERLSDIKKQIAETEDAIRETALHLSSKDDYETRDFSGVKVKKFNIVEVLDESEAKKWAIQFVPEAVSLSKTKFHSSVRNLNLPFIEKKTEYRAQIPSKL